MGLGEYAADGVEPIAAAAMEGRLAALALEAGVIAAVIVEPQAEEGHGQDETIEDRCVDDIHESAENVGAMRRAVKNKNAPKRTSTR
jgi:hypothetical protein